MSSADALQRAAQLLQHGALQEARAVLAPIVAAELENVDALNLLGIALAQSGDLTGAAETLDRAARINPQHAGVHLNLGNTLRTLGRLNEAADSYRRAAGLRPDGFAVHQHLGSVLLDLQRFDDAVGAFNAAARLRPDHPAPYLGRARAARALGNAPAALYDIDNVVRIDPSNVEALTMRAALFRGMNRREDALADCDRALGADPQSWSLHNNRGVLLDEMGRTAEALACFEQSLRLNPNNPDAFQNLGTALVALGRGEEAIARFDETLALDPRDADVLNCKGAVQIAMRRFEGALESFTNAVAVRADSTISQFHRAFPLLALGRLQEGFEAYEWRRRGPTPFVVQPQFPQPELVAGEDPQGKRILLYGEQGMGDVIQFARFASVFAARGAKVVLAAYPALAPLLTTLGPEIEIVPPEGAAPVFDFTCPLLSAPHKLGTTIESIPATVPYLSVRQARRDAWRARLAGIAPGLRVGLAWSGNAQYANDWTRSIAFEKLGAILGVPGATYVCTQKDLRPSDEASFANAGVIDVRDELTDFGETAALIDQLDLVITVDTVLAHLAGALGKPVWVLLSAVSDWRWLEHRTDSPWYPTARLFRQRTLGDWAPVFAEVKAELSALSAKKSSGK
jgi:tetratricopeptide (TPR) repeat protein